MGKAILAGVVGYVALFVVLFATFTGLYVVVGAGRAFKPGSYDVSNLWLGAAVVVNLFAAIVGGLVCRKIAGRVKPVRGFAVVVFALGLAMAGWSAFNVKPEAVRGGDVKNLAAMQDARVPSWFEFTNSFTGAIGILIGGRALGSKKRD